MAFQSLWLRNVAERIDGAASPLILAFPSLYPHVAHGPWKAYLKLDMYYGGNISNAEAAEQERE
jgi:hypothetical protein